MKKTIHCDVCGSDHPEPSCPEKIKLKKKTSKIGWMEPYHLHGLKWTTENEDFRYLKFPLVTFGKDKMFIRDFGKDSLIRVKVTMEEI